MIKVCIFGAGSIGGYLAACLSKNNIDLSLIARGPHKKAIEENGLTLIKKDKTENFKFRVADDPKELGNQDYIFQTDFDLDQTIRYEKDAMIDFIPAGFLLLSKKEFCEGFIIDICDNKECVIRQKNSDNKIEIFFKDLKIEQLNFSGPKYDETKILFGNMTLMNDINESAFSYNQEVKDLLIIDKK